MKTLLVIIPTLALACGCASVTSQWTSSGFANMPLEQAAAECEFEAEKAAAAAPRAYEKVKNACMRAKGFTLVTVEA